MLWCVIYVDVSFLIKELSLGLGSICLLLILGLLLGLGLAALAPVLGELLLDASGEVVVPLRQALAEVEANEAADLGGIAVAKTTKKKPREVDLA